MSNTPTKEQIAEALVFMYTHGHFAKYPPYERLSYDLFRLINDKDPKTILYLTNIDWELFLESQTN